MSIGSASVDPVIDAIATTRAIRRYRPEPIPEDDLNAMLYAASRAPTGSNRQGTRWIVLRDDPVSVQARELLGKGARAIWGPKRANDGYDSGTGTQGDSPKARVAKTMERFVETFGEAPVIVLACLWLHRGNDISAGGHVYPGVQNLLLAARSLGYGGVITGFHGPVEDELRHLLGIPTAKEVAIAATIPLGRPEGKHGPVRRRPLAEIVYEGRWERSATWAVDPEDSRFTSAGPPSGLRK